MKSKQNKFETLKFTWRKMKRELKWCNDAFTNGVNFFAHQLLPLVWRLYVTKICVFFPFSFVCLSINLLQCTYLSLLYSLTLTDLINAEISLFSDFIYMMCIKCTFLHLHSFNPRNLIYFSFLHVFISAKFIVQFDIIFIFSTIHYFFAYLFSSVSFEQLAYCFNKQNQLE